jgi:hypothetical protein
MEQAENCLRQSNQTVDTATLVKAAQDYMAALDRLVANKTAGKSSQEP